MQVEKMMIAVVALFALTVVDSALTMSYAGDADNCIQYGPRRDGGSQGVWVQNNCGRVVTFIVTSPGNMDYLTIRPNSWFNWTTGDFARWGACYGEARTSC